MIRATALAALLLTTGCAGGVANVVHDATQSGVSTLDSPVDKAELDDIARSLAATGATAARDVVLSPETTARVDALETRVVTRAQATLVATERVVLADLEARAPGIVQAVIDRLTSPENVEKLLAILDEVRERFAGAPLRADIAAAAAEARQQAAQVRADADAEIAKYRWAVWAMGVMSLLLLVLHIRREILVAKGSRA